MEGVKIKNQIKKILDEIRGGDYGQPVPQDSRLLWKTGEANIPILIFSGTFPRDVDLCGWAGVYEGDSRFVFAFINERLRNKKVRLKTLLHEFLHCILRTIDPASSHIFKNSECEELFVNAFESLFEKLFILKTKKEVKL